MSDTSVNSLDLQRVPPLQHSTATSSPWVKDPTPNIFLSTARYPVSHHTFSWMPPFSSRKVPVILFSSCWDCLQCAQNRLPPAAPINLSWAPCTEFSNSENGLSPLVLISLWRVRIGNIKCLYGFHAKGSFRTLKKPLQCLKLTLLYRR